MRDTLEIKVIMLHNKLVTRHPTCLVILTILIRQCCPAPNPTSRSINNRDEPNAAEIDDDKSNNDSRIDTTIHVEDASTNLQWTSMAGDFLPNQSEPLKNGN